MVKNCEKLGCECPRKDQRCWGKGASSSPRPTYLRGQHTWPRRVGEPCQLSAHPASQRAQLRQCPLPSRGARSPPTPVQRSAMLWPPSWSEQELPPRYAKIYRVHQPSGHPPPALLAPRRDNFLRCVHCARTCYNASCRGPGVSLVGRGGSPHLVHGVGLRVRVGGEPVSPRPYSEFA